MDTKKAAWEEAYNNRDNIVFYPDEHVVRTMAYYVKKRVGLDEYITKRDVKTVLDLGCGMGRHVKYLDEMGYETYGIDLSETAIGLAKKWFSSVNKEYLSEKIQSGSATDLPYADAFFDLVLSYGMLDCMHFELALQSVNEATRVLKTGGIFIVDVYSDNFEEKGNEGYEVIAETNGTAANTVRSYFDMAKLNQLLGGRYTIIDHRLMHTKSFTNKTDLYRMHLVLEKK